MDIINTLKHEFNKSNKLLNQFKPREPSPNNPSTLENPPCLKKMLKMNTLARLQRLFHRENHPFKTKSLQNNLCSHTKPMLLPLCILNTDFKTSKLTSNNPLSNSNSCLTKVTSKLLTPWLLFTKTMATETSNQQWTRRTNSHSARNSSNQTIPAS